MRSGRSNGKSRQRVAYVLMKVVFATPIASASVRMAPAVAHPFLGEDAPRKSHVCSQIGQGARATDVAARLFDLVEAARRQPDLPAHVGF